MSKQSVRYKSVQVDGINIFYREAGRRGRQPIILLNGMTGGSAVFEELMEELKGNYYLVAPDFPGLGLSDTPGRDVYTYTLDNISGTIERFMAVVGLLRPSVYALGWGGAVAFGIAMRNPEAFGAFIVQNANVYSEGLGPAMADDDRYRAALRDMAGPGGEEIQGALLGDYVNNMDRYGQWGEWLRARQPKMLLIWGMRDVFFPTAEAEALKGDVPGTKLYLYDTGYRALEEYHREIAGNISFFLG